METQIQEHNVDSDEKKPITQQQNDEHPGTAGPYTQPNSNRVSVDEETIDDDDSAAFNFYILAGIAQVIGITCLVMAIVWVVHFRGGFAWDGSGKEFNYHPVFMIAGLVVLYGNGALVYRVFRTTQKAYTKLIHMTIQILAFIFTVLGLVTVFDFHNKSNIPNMYSLHSWVGMSAVLLFSCQLLFGFLAFLFPKFPDAYRSTYLMVHQYFGSAIFVLSVGNCLTGLTEKLLFSIKSTYSKFPKEGILANTLAVALIIFGGLVMHLVTHKKYKRRPDNTTGYSLIK